MNTIYITCIPFMNRYSAKKCLDDTGFNGNVVPMTNKLWNDLLDSTETTGYINNTLDSVDDSINRILNSWSDSDKKRLYQMLYNSGMRI